MYKREGKSAFIFYLTVIAVFVLSGCGSTVMTWNGYENENLSRYIEVKEYKGLKYSAGETAVTDAEAEAEINRRLYEMAAVTETDDAVKDGSTVKFDRYCFIGGLSTPSMSEEDAVYTVGKCEDEVTSLLLEKMIGMKTGETAEYTLEYTDVSGGQEAVKKNVTYRVTVKAVYEKTVPELNDETAEQLVPGCGGADGCRAAVKSRLAEEKNKSVLESVRSQLWSSVLDGCSMKKVPAELLDEAFKRKYDMYAVLADKESLTMSEYAEIYLKMSENELNKLINDSAFEEVRESLAVYSIAKKEGITVNDAEISAFASRMADRSDGAFDTGEHYILYYGKDTVKTQCLKEAVIDFIVSSAVRG